MQLVNCIRFSYLADQLTAEETQLFLNDLVSTKPKVVIQALFAYFNQTPCPAEHVSFNTECMQKISEMINARESDRVKTEERSSKAHLNELPKCESLDEVPQNVIGFISSFLNQREHATLSQCNRSIYLGCNNPKTFTHIRMIFKRRTPQKATPDLTTNPQLKQMMISLENGPLQDYSIMKHWAQGMNTLQLLEKLIIHNNVGINHQYETLVLLSDLNGALCQQINTMRIDLDSEKEDMINELCKFTNLKYLGLRFTVFNQSKPSKRQADDLVSALVNLQGLAFDDCSQDGVFTQTLFRRTGLNLRYLELRNFGKRNWFNRIKLSNLEQLWLDHQSLPVFEDVLAIVSDLRKVKISTNSLRNETNRWNPRIYQQIRELFVRSQSLEYFSCCCSNGSVLDAITNGLISTKKVKRKSLKIRIQGTQRLNVPSKAITVMRLIRIIESLASSDIQDFMLIMEGWKFEERNNIWISKDDFNSAILPSNVRMFDGSTDMDGIQSKLIVTNEDCKINGFSESWLM